MAQKPRKNIFLIGFSYTGKSRVAQLVASQLGWKYVDLDREIIRIAGKTIPEIFSGDGERTFRLLESQVLKQACEEGGQVIATGGGVILSEENRSLMKESGLIISLEASPEIIYQRLVKDAQEASSLEIRPLLAGKNPMETISNLKEKRQPYYGIAHWTITTDALSIEEVTMEVARAWNDWNKITK